MIAESAHIPAYRNFPDSYFIGAICDINEAAARDIAQRCDIPRYYTDASEMLEQEKPDVVSVCVPNRFHKEYSMLALSFGANVLCEKPVAVTYADACEMYSFAKKHGKVLMGCQSMRFTPDRLAAKKYIETEGLGEIYYAEFSRVRRRGIPYWGSFHKSSVNLGGAMLDIGVHMLDALVFLCGGLDPVAVSAYTGQHHKDELGSAEGSGALLGNRKSQKTFRPEEMDVEDFACGNIKLSGGSVNFKVAWAANLPECTEIRISGKNAGICLPEGKVYRGENTELDLDITPPKYEHPFSGHFHIVENLCNVLSGKEQPVVREEEVKTVAAILEMFYISARENREVTFREIVGE